MRRKSITGKCLTCCLSDVCTSEYNIHGCTDLQTIEEWITTLQNEINGDALYDNVLYTHLIK